MDEQLSLDLQDDIQKYTKIAESMVENHKYNGYTSAYIFNRNNKYYLGTRTFIVETDYTYDHEISWDVAKYLYQNVDGIFDFMGSINERLKEESDVLTCKICGCEKTKEELKEYHKNSCFSPKNN